MHIWTVRNRLDMLYVHIYACNRHRHTATQWHMHTHTPRIVKDTMNVRRGENREGVGVKRG